MNKTTTNLMLAGAAILAAIISAVATIVAALID
jgi:hypothetical protein